MTNLQERRCTVESFVSGDEDDDFGVGLMCGGDLHVLVQPMTELQHAIQAMDAGGRDTPPRAVVRSLTGAQLGRAVVLDLDTVTADELERRVGPGVGVQLAQIRSGGAHSLVVRQHGAVDGPATHRLLVEAFRTRPRLVIYGANDFAAALAAIAPRLDYHVVVCDARPIFATTSRHPGADEVTVGHPADHLSGQLAAGLLDRRGAVVVLTHDPRYDLPVLDLALRADVGYVGAMGSRLTHERRRQELVNGGLPPALLNRLRSPIGLNLGAVTPAEVAVSILAEIISATHGPVPDEDVVALRHTSGPVHQARRVPQTNALVDPSEQRIDGYDLGR